MWETPFMLTYGSKAILPIEVALHTHRLTIFQETLNNVAMWQAFDSVPSVQGNALLHEALYKLCIARLYYRTIKFHPISVGSLVLWRTKVMA